MARQWIAINKFPILQLQNAVLITLIPALAKQLQPFYNILYFWNTLYLPICVLVTNGCGSFRDIDIESSGTLFIVLLRFLPVCFVVILVVVVFVVEWIALKILLCLLSTKKIVLIALSKAYISLLVFFLCNLSRFFKSPLEAYQCPFFDVCSSQCTFQASAML